MLRTWYTSKNEITLGRAKHYKRQIGIRSPKPHLRKRLFVPLHTSHVVGVSQTWNSSRYQYSIQAAHDYSASISHTVVPSTVLKCWSMAEPRACELRKSETAMQLLYVLQGSRIKGDVADYKWLFGLIRMMHDFPWCTLLLCDMMRFVPISCTISAH